MLKYYLAEAVVTKQSIFLSSADENTEKIIKELPGSLTTATVSAVTHVSSNKPDSESAAVEDKDEKMKIAWRYQNQKKVQGAPIVSQFGHYYDLTRTMDPNLLDPDLIFHGPAIDLNSSSSFSESPPHMNKHYQSLFLNIRDRIREGGFSTSHHAEKRSILRIGVYWCAADCSNLQNLSI
ncbi:elongator complex protein 4-like [Elysia marginata]|uniref:Elongator complex protein 4 n=1 Tax=Elysia marginata TaxID=1093978 RepID=A0AAV4G6P4_9GAST|nr:elongator complex protein 4-like [Elysia marginata]